MLGNHIRLVKYHDLSPWLGAGFGMFSTVDSPASRQLYFYGVDKNGRDWRIVMPKKLQEAASKVKALPSQWQANQFWMEFDAYQLQSNCSTDSYPFYPNYRIEVWKRRYDSETLRGQSGQLRAYRHGRGADDCR